MTTPSGGTRPAGGVAPVARRTGAGAVSWLWAAVPLITLGLGTWAAFLYAAVRRRSWWLGGTAAGYTLVLVVWLIAAAPVHPGPLAAGITGVAFLVSIAGGCANTFAIRGRVFGPGGPRQADPLLTAEAEVLRRRKLRQEARQVVTHDPALARELRIGRPDLLRDYDDGGLVDVNHAPAAVLATLPGLTPALAGKLVTLRESRGSFVSADEVSLELGLPPDAVPALAALTVYLS